MNTYEIKFGGKTEIIKGVSLEDALEKYGFTNISITPLWKGKSNGEYKAHCSETTIVQCKWIEKINQL